jgi:hypothetical protein
VVEPVAVALAGPALVVDWPASVPAFVVVDVGSAVVLDGASAVVVPALVVDVGSAVVDVSDVVDGSGVVVVPDVVVAGSSPSPPSDPMA